ncbi:hypothetical protein [Peribacillus simplex]|uniref:Uncharacterized protein n=1 Tax=Peribacillus simplex TaxID=1478 RepID=A0AAN2TTI1_9BACI|nr:hypothetical protein [Peribacillus simplex]CEG33026.1 hypothetical protein BN1180_03198 [Peribacillus simplex]
MADMKINVNAFWDGGVTGNGTLKAEYLDTKKYPIGRLFLVST